MSLSQYPNALTFQSLCCAIRTDTYSACEKQEQVQVFIFFHESKDASFDSLSVSEVGWHRALNAEQADVPLKIVKGDLSRRLPVMTGMVSC